MGSPETRSFLQEPTVAKGAKRLPVLEAEVKEEIVSAKGMDRFFKRLVDTRDDYSAHWRTLLQGLKEIHETKQGAIHLDLSIVSGKKNISQSQHYILIMPKPTPVLAEILFY